MNDATLVGGLDEGFPRRVLRTSVWITVAVLGVATLEQEWGIVVGFGAGAAINIAAFLALDGTLGALLRTEGRPAGARWFWTAVAFAKLPALLLAMGAAIAFLDMNYIAFAASLGLTQAVMISKVASLVVVDSMNRWIPAPTPKSEVLSPGSHVR